MNMSNVSTNSTSNICRVDSEVSSTSVKIAASGIIIVGSIGFISNVVVDYVIYRLRLYRILGHIFIFSLSVSDMIQGLIMPIFDATELLSDSGASTSQEWCRLHAGFSILAVLSTCMNLVSISVDRCIAIFMPLHYHEIVTSNRVHVYLFVLWLSMLTWTAIPSLGWHSNATCLRQGNTICDFGNVLNFDYFIATSIVVLTAVIIVVILQTAIYIQAIKQANKIFDKSNKREWKEAQKKVTRIVGFVVMTFFITYIPWFSLSIRTVVTQIGGQFIIIICNYLLYINAALNPLVYAASDRNIRSEARKFLRLQGLGENAVHPIGNASKERNSQEQRSPNVIT